MTLYDQLVHATQQITKISERIARLRASQEPHILMDDMPHAHNVHGLENYAAELDALESDLMYWIHERNRIKRKMSIRNKNRHTIS